MTKEQEEQGFRVTDKRGFNQDGEPCTPEPAKNVEKEPAGEASASADAKSSGQEAPPRPAIDFPSYILGYYTQGLVLLGEVPNPYTNKKEEDVEAARHTIDILSMLEEKTKGNLSKEENQLLENVLFELRMKFMAKTNRIKI
ncbi:MAG: DUF1844 domain-containing protein [Rubrivivax sp.]|nr:DUF1844 domain-containing protein [Rubrivivax sp.]